MSPIDVKQDLFGNRPQKQAAGLKWFKSLEGGRRFIGSGNGGPGGPETGSYGSGVR